VFGQWNCELGNCQSSKRAKYNHLYAKYSFLKDIHNGKELPTSFNAFSNNMYL